jgi:hypothetical protein
MIRTRVLGLFAALALAGVLLSALAAQAQA